MAVAIVARVGGNLVALVEGARIDAAAAVDDLAVERTAPASLGEGIAGGAGALVPITGFANSVAAPAIEFKSEGQVFGVGCKIFTIAGPVILYGIFTSWVLGVIYWILKLMGVM